MTYKWVNLFPLAQAETLVYFEAYVNNQTNQAAGWIVRTGVNEPYSYSIYYVVSATGAVVTDTRGTWKHARWAVQGAIERQLTANS